MVKELDRKKLWKILHDAKNHYHTNYGDGTCSLDGEIYKLTGAEFTGGEILEKEKLANEKRAKEQEKEKEDKQKEYDSRRHGTGIESEESEQPQTSDVVEREAIDMSLPKEGVAKRRFI